MSHKIIQRPNCSRSPYPRQKSPTYLSPKPKQKQPQNPPNFHHQVAPLPNQPQIPHDPNHRNPSQLPLQFSSCRKQKPKHPQPYPTPITNFINPTTPFISTPYKINQQISQERSNNQNRSFENGDCGRMELNKVRKFYENQMRNQLQKFRCIQAEYQIKLGNLEREKNYWKESFVIMREEYEMCAKRDGIKLDQPKQSHENTNQSNGQNTKNVTKPQQQILILQQQIQKHENSSKIAQNQLYNLNKQKAQLTYELQLARQQLQKSKLLISELQNSLEIQIKQNKQVREREKEKERDNVMVRSLDIKCSNLSGLSLSFDGQGGSQGIGGEMGRRSNSGSKSRDLGSSRHKSSKHRSTHHRQPQQPTQYQPQDLQKQLQRSRHITRKLQKTLSNQNIQIISQGLRNLNSKYKKIWQQQQQQEISEPKLMEISSNSRNGNGNDGNNQNQNRRGKQPVNFKFPWTVDGTKCKITSIKYI